MVYDAIIKLKLVLTIVKFIGMKRFLRACAVNSLILMVAHAYNIIFMFSTNDWNLKYAEVASSTARLQAKRAKAS